MKRSAEDIERIAELEAELGRYSMCAGHAEQRRAESRAIRQALGFEPDADDVSPNDLLMALVRIKAEWQADMLEELISRSKAIGTDEPWTVEELEQEEANLRRRAKEPTP